MRYMSVNSTCSVNIQLTHIDNIWVFLDSYIADVFLARRYGTVNYFEVLLIDVRNRCRYVSAHDLEYMHNVITYRVNGTLTQNMQRCSQHIILEKYIFKKAWSGDCYRCVNCCVNIYWSHLNIFKYSLENVSTLRSLRQRTGSLQIR